ncbi:hypothetical protein LIER_27040 [Lithospermum erythrorhizon]|uniref:Uncharacterized protein n=1 Tax=Lithospermum erythrorhizon TaxID=34254 RepID=A0AAV3RES0_LITER
MVLRTDDFKEGQNLWKKMWLSPSRPGLLKGMKLFITTKISLSVMGLEIRDNCVCSSSGMKELVNERSRSLKCMLSKISLFQACALLAKDFEMELKGPTSQDQWLLTRVGAGLACLTGRPPNLSEEDNKSLKSPTRSQGSIVLRCDLVREFFAPLQFHARIDTILGRFVKKTLEPRWRKELHMDTW